MAKYHNFWKFLAKKHSFRNKWQSTAFSRTRASKTQVPLQFYHRGTAELEFMRLKKIMWYSSLVNLSTMQHSTRVYQARVSFIKKKKKLHSTRVLCKFFFFLKGTRACYTRVLCCMVLEFTKLEYHIIFFRRTNSNSAVSRWQN